MSPCADTRVVVEHVGSRWEALRGARILVTGGTGFIGRWLLESFVVANRKWELDASAIVLTRRPREFALNSPELAQDASIELREGDVRELTPEFAFGHACDPWGNAGQRGAKQY